MDVAFVLYDQMTALDLIGPYEALAGHPQVRPHFVAERTGGVRCDNGIVLQADAAFAGLPTADLIVVPGSSRWRASLQDAALVGWLAAACPAAGQVVTVCTGSLLLGRAGLLAGRPATTHWAMRDVLAGFGAVVRTDRVVDDGDVISCAGVSAGIDLGLALAARLWGAPTAEAIQLALEYDPRPPFDSGSPDKADPEMVAAVRTRLTADRTS